MPEIVDKVERNLRDRAARVRTTISTEITVVKTAISDLLALKPVKAVTGFVKGTVDNVAEGINTQADITRRWLP